MEYLHERVHGTLYYWEYIKRFGKESYHTLRRDFGITLLLAIITVSLAWVWGDRTMLQDALLGAEAVVLLYGLITLWHLLHTSLILFRERAHPEYGGVRYTPWGYGVWGAGVVLALIMAITYGGFYEWLRKLPPVVLNMPAPAAPIIRAQQAVNPPESNARHETKTLRPLAQTTEPKIPTPNTANQTPQQVPKQVAPSPPPATFLDRVVQENRALTPDDRNRFSTELYECNQFIEQSRAVAYKLNAEFGKLTNDRGSGTLAKNVDDHIKILRQLDKPAWDQYHGLQNFQGKWQYFTDQTEYLFGDNPFNAGVGLLVNATEGMANSLTSWSKISNRDQRDILNIEGQQQVEYEANLGQFFAWTNDTLGRLKQMRQSLDPNVVVQPLRPTAVAPARPF